MKKTALVVLLLSSALAWAGSDPNPADYTVVVHVSSSSLQFDFQAFYIRRQKLNVVIEGKKYQLESELQIRQVLALGDYKAKLVKNEQKTGYDSTRVYEFLFPDNKTRRFEVVGQEE